MRLFHLLAFSIFLNCTGTQRKDLNHENKKEVSLVNDEIVASSINYLNKEFPVLRIGVGNSDNYGHQSASFEVLRSLIRLGYHGSFEVISNDMTSSRFKNLSIEFKGAKNIKYISPEEARKEKRSLGFVGGYDLYHSNKNGPSTLNVETTLVLQPLQWPWKRLICSKNKIDSSYCKASKISFCEEFCFEPEAFSNQNLSFHYDPNPGKNFEDIAKDLENHDQIHKTVAIVDAVQNKKINFMTAYSLGHTGDHGLCKLVTALRYYQKHSDPKGIVLIGFNSKEPLCKHEMKKLTHQHLSHVSPVVIPNENEILVLQTDSVPQRVFRELVRQSNLPPVLEGANMTNFLRLLQRPYISTSLMHTQIPKLESREKVLEKIIKVTDEINDWIYRYSDKVDEEDTKELNKASIDEAAASIGQFIMDAMNPNSEISQYFKELGRINLLPENDMVAVGIVELVKYLSHHNESK